MKPTLFYTVARRSYFGSLEVMRVTTEKMVMLYGSGQEGTPTHKRASDCHGRFPSEETARACLRLIDACKGRYNVEYRALDRRRDELRQMEKQEISAIVAKAASQAKAAA